MPTALKLTANIPAFLRNSRREGVTFEFSSSCSTCRGMPLKGVMRSPPFSPTAARLRLPSRRA